MMMADDTVKAMIANLIQDCKKNNT
jgi:hypothetical protein